MIPNLRWRKSSKSAGNDGDCVEIGLDHGGALRAVRDSKNREHELIGDIPAFVAAVKAGSVT